MRRSGVVVMGLALGCGSPPPASQAPLAPPLELESVDELRPYAATRPLSTAVEQPALWLGMKSPSRLWAELPALRDAVLPGGAIAAVASLLGHEAASLIDLDQPVDVVTALPALRGSGTTWSFRVRSAEALARGDVGITLRELRQGVWRIGKPELDEPAPEPGDYDDDVEFEEPAEVSLTPQCQLHHYPAPVGYRVICSTSAEHIEQHAPFLTSKSVLAPRETDALVRLGGPRYHAFLQAGLAAVKAQAAAGDGEPGEKLGRQLGAELVEALVKHETLALDLSVQGGKVSARLDMAFSEAHGSERFEAWLAAADHAVLPESYSRLPTDSNVRLGFAGLRGPVGTQLFEYLLEQFVEDLERTAILPGKARAELMSAARAALPEGAAFTLAWGRDRALAERALAAWGSLDYGVASPTPEQERSLQEGLGGWWVLGVDAPAKQYLPRLARLLDVSMAPLRDRPGVATAKVRSALSRAARKLAGLPPGALHYVHRTRSADQAILSHDLHLLLVPDGARVWIVAARSPQLALSKAREQLQRSAGPSATPERALAALSLTLDTLVGPPLAWDTLIDRGLARESLDVLNSLPHAGKTRLPFTLRVLPRGVAGAGWHLQLESEVTSAELEELLAWRGLVGGE